MTQFEFIFVLVSIILGLGLANLFGGISRQLQQEWQAIDGAHLTFAFGIVLAIFVVWWGMYRWHDHADFEFTTFAVIAVYTSVFYAMSAILYPRDGLLRSFDEVRTPFFCAIVLYLLLEIPYYQIAGFDRPYFYWYAVTPPLGLLIAAICLRRKALDLILAVSWFVVWSGWWFVAKFGGWRQELRCCTNV